MLLLKTPSFSSKTDPMQRILQGICLGLILPELSVLHLTTLQSALSLTFPRLCIAPSLPPLPPLPQASTPLALQPASSQVLSEPFGVVLVLGAWNYPFSEWQHHPMRTCLAELTSPDQ